MTREDADGWGIDLGEPDRLPAGGVLDGEVETPVAGEQRPDPQRTVDVLVVRLAHGDSGRPVGPGRHPATP
ncbi:hypothetical protein QDX25_09340 [Auritidibacter ignavus]|uniref:hypothetical protein n=1 Tax=Auritidibacter ignavus TaxID=678932 RepID=UPI001FD1A6DC|nr:hypothetical protein [Auritidibacter ignavus]WGH80989.1 hypothetical protein QDX25_09340 [Auritidibacter ignavus]WHS36001.1 hypothetical protein QM403_05490 [Auritidibacter ignavus]